MSASDYLNQLFAPPFTVLDGILDYALRFKETKISDYVYKTLAIANRVEMYIHQCVSEEIASTSLIPLNTRE